MRVGGKAYKIILPKDISEVSQAVEYCKRKNREFFVLGNGTNVIFDDNGYNGIIISLKNMNKIRREGDCLVAEAGVNLMQLCRFAAEEGLSGIEALYGIPGSVGGAVKMNAGAYGWEFCQFLQQITTFSDGQIRQYDNFDYTYRRGPLKTGEILLCVKIKLKTDKKEKILEKMSQFLQKRVTFQPYCQASSGSIFKRKDRVIPAKLIDEWGLKGLKIGDAQVSDKHAGFIVNLGSASSHDIKLLIQIIQFIAERKGYKFDTEVVLK